MPRGASVTPTLTNNEISGNATYNWEQVDPGCGCSGGGKFWQTDGATVTGNYVYDNRNVGLWVDTDISGLTSPTTTSPTTIRRDHLRDQSQRPNLSQHPGRQRSWRWTPQSGVPERHRLPLRVGQRPPGPWSLRLRAADHRKPARETTVPEWFFGRVLTGSAGSPTTPPPGPARWSIRGQSPCGAVTRRISRGPPRPASGRLLRRLPVEDPEHGSDRQHLRLLPRPPSAGTAPAADGCGMQRSFFQFGTSLSWWPY